MADAQFHTLRIADIRRETDESVSVAFTVPDALRDRFAWVPGQYLTLRTVLDGQEVRRAYSICSGLDDDELRVAVKHVEGGTFSAWMNSALRSGDTVEVMAPDGRFGIAPDPAATRVYLGLAAGSGITPILSILRSVLAREPRSRFVLLYGNRTTASIMFRETLHDLKDRFLDRLTVLHVLSRETQDIPALSGRLDGAKLRTLLPTVLAPERISHAFVCGPATMIDDLTATLADLGLRPDRIHTERFTPSGAAPPPAPRPAAEASAFATAAITFDGKTTTVPVAEGEAILDAGERAGLVLPWSCRGGMCGTCRARLTEGTVEMAQNFALEPWETAQGFVLTCQSHPTAAHVALDYDHV
jgi:ring-1,2-phenylacetyl-CoA epoxidase subunit PaaE